MEAARGRRQRRFIGYPTDSLLGVVRDAEAAAKVTAALKAAGIPDRDITILRGEESAARFDPTGAVHGLFTRLRRIVSFTVMDQLPDMAWYDAAVRAGHAVVMAKVRGDDRKRPKPCASSATTVRISSTTTADSRPRRSSAGRGRSLPSPTSSSADQASSSADQAAALPHRDRRRDHRQIDQRISLDEDEVGHFADLDRAGLRLHAEQPRAG